MSAPFPLYSWLLGDLPDVDLLIRLYQSIHSPTPFPSLADFKEANYPGYAAVPLTFPALYTPLPNGSLFVALSGLVWSVRDNGSPGCLVNGLYISSVEPDSVTRLVAWIPFESPQKLLTSADWLGTDCSLAAFQYTTPSA